MVKEPKEYYEEDIEKQLLLLFDGRYYYHHKGISVYEYLILDGEINKVKDVLGWVSDFSNGVLSMLLWRMFITEHNYDPSVWLNFYRGLPSRIAGVEDPSSIYFQMITGDELTKTASFEYIENMDPNNLHSVISFMNESLEEVDLYAAYADLMSSRPVFYALIDIQDNESSLMEAQKKYGMATEEIPFDYVNIVEMLLEYEKGGFFDHEGGYFDDTYNPKKPLAFTNQSTARWLGLNRNIYHLLRDSYTQLMLNTAVDEAKWYYYDTYGDYVVAWGTPGTPSKLLSISEITQNTEGLVEIQTLLSSEDNNSNVYNSEIERILSYTTHRSKYNTPKLIEQDDVYIIEMEKLMKPPVFNLSAFISVTYLYIYFALGLTEKDGIPIFDKKSSIRRTKIQDLYLSSLLNSDVAMREWVKKVPILNHDGQSVTLTGTNISNLYDLTQSRNICIVYKGYHLHWIARKLLRIFAGHFSTTPQYIINDWMTSDIAAVLLPHNIIKNHLIHDGVNPETVDYDMYPFKTFDLDLERMSIDI